MASGTLGTGNPAASTWTTIYTVPVGKVATVNIRLTNLSISGTNLIRLAIGPADGAPATQGEYIEPIDYVMGGSELVEDFGLVMGAGDKVKAFCNTTNLAVRVHGFESNP